MYVRELNFEISENRPFLFPYLSSVMKGDSALTLLNVKALLNTPLRKGAKLLIPKAKRGHTSGM